ncbi:hypothetical protein R50072_12040 [Simiduia litorea]|uniref:hypothetical protein n=1 Tax=Simiduia litorea TaxID=1435348 RepID=UPI0036F1A569
MKLLNRSLILFTLIITSGCSSAQTAWNTDGSFTKNGHRIDTSLDNSYLGFESEHGLFVAGYKIDPNGENIPYIVLLESNKATPSEWGIDDSALQFFEHKGAVQLATYRGGHYVFTNAGWHKGELVFKKNSLILSDHSSLLACNRPSLYKENEDTSSCYSPVLGWSTPILWVDADPQLCHGKLVALIKQEGELSRVEIDINNGNILSSRHHQSNQPLCN